MAQKAPYAGHSDFSVLNEISKGILPDFPSDIAQSQDHQIVSLRNICARCWEWDMARRPDMKSVLKTLEELP